MIADTLKIRVTSADIPALLRKLEAWEFAVHNMEACDSFSVICTVSRKDYSQVEKFARQRGDCVEIIEHKGCFRVLRGIFRRPILLTGIIGILLLSIILPTRILFVRVEGNSTVSSQLVLDKAASSGIYFGASRRSVRNEQFKNQILSAIPKLQWAGVNTSGCVATVTVREKTQFEPPSLPGKVSSIVASCDGIITECTAKSGNLLCAAGQAVKCGQVLISGYTDCGLSLRAERADGEIYADTIHSIRAVSPAEYDMRCAEEDRWTNFGIIIGKKLIFLRKDSRILDGTCGKMYKQKNITLPGGFSLPVTFVTEEYISYDMTRAELPSDTCSRYLCDAAAHYLEEQLVSGRIIDTVLILQQKDGTIQLTGNYVCNEMIGRVITEESIYHYGENR